MRPTSNIAKGNYNLLPRIKILNNDSSIQNLANQLGDVYINPSDNFNNITVDYTENQPY